MKKIFAILLVSGLIGSTVTNAQWANTSLGNLNDVCFVKGSMTNAFAVGDNGLVLKTTNGGANWMQVSVPSSAPLSKICFATSTAGYIAEDGSYARILKTIDGGTTWTVLTPSIGYNIRKIYFTGKDTGFVVTGYDGGIFRTINGGLTWNLVQPLMDFMNDITFVSPSKGFAVADNNKLYKTVDYGQTWALTDTFIHYGTLNSVYFTDPNTGYIAQTNGWVFKTTDGGINWNYSYVGMNLQKVCFFGPMNGVALAMNGEYYKYNGMSWSSPADTIKGAMINGIALTPGAPNGIMVGMSGALVNTSNGGTNWNILNIGIQNIYSLAFTSATTGYIGGNNLTILKTTDGGATLLPSYKGGMGGYDFKKIQFLDANNGFAGAGDGKVYKTINGGTNWTPVDVTGGVYGINSLAFANTSVGLVADNMGSTYLTVNGGSSYSFRNTYPFSDIEFITGSTNTAVAVTSGYIFRTTDTGSIFNNVHYGGPMVYYNDVFVLSPSVVYVCGSWNGSGIIIRSNDGGITWPDSLNVGFVLGLKSIYFSDANNGYAVGQMGTIIKTTNGGTTWTSYNLGSMNDFNTVIYNGGSWYAGGMNGIIKLMSISVTPDTMTIGYTPGSSATINVTGTGNWKAFSSVPYLTVSPGSGTGAATVTITSPQSLLNKIDSASIYITVNQAGVITRDIPVAKIKAKHEVFFTLDTIRLYADSISQAHAETLSFYLACSQPLTLTGTSSWIKPINLQFTNVNNGIWQYQIYSVRAQDNTSAAPRNGSITFSAPVLGTLSVPVVQYGIEPYFFTSEVSFTVPVAGEKDTFMIGTNTSWTLKVSHPWLTVAPMSGTGNTQVIITTSANTLSWQRAAMITLYPLGWQPTAVSVLQEGTGGGTVTCSHQAKILNTGIGTLCNGDSVLLTANAGTGYIYQWFIDGLQVQGGMNNTLNCTKQGTYVVGVTSNSCTLLSDPLTVNFNPSVAIPEIAVKSGSIAPCTGGSIVLETKTAYTSYKWSTGETNATISITKSGHFDVEVADVNGCKAKSADFEINASEATTPEICLVNVDRIENKNTVIWKRAAAEKIKSYIVYKETTKAGEYKPIDTVAYNEYNLVIDTKSFPEVQSNRYRVSAIDSCDVESPMSVIHKTLHLTLNQRYGGGVNLIWENYEGLDISSYTIYHGDGPTTMDVLTEVPSNIFTYSIITGAKLYYQIGIDLPAQCDITKTLKAESGPYSQSLSNIAEFKGLAVQNTGITGVSAYPNPFADAVNVQYTLSKPSDVRIEIVNAIGQKAAEQKLDDQDAGQYTQTLDAQKLNMVPGLYTIRIIIGDEIETLKVVCR